MPPGSGEAGEVLAEAHETGHQLYWSVHQKSGMRVLSCKRCDSYATLAPKHLLGKCQPKANKPNWDKLVAGKFPTNKFGNYVCLSLPFPAIATKKWVSTYSQSSQVLRLSHWKTAGD